MAEWGGALEVGGLPSSASIDELSVLLSQLAHCRQHHILLSSRGAASAVAALVLLPSTDAASSVADMLDSYPLSGGLLETRPCADPADWVRRHVLQHLPKVGSRRPQAPPPAQPAQPPAPQPLRPPAPQPMQPPPPQPQQPPAPQPLAITTSGLTALEAEAREVQRMLQEQQQLFGGGGGGWDAEEEGEPSNGEGDWSQVGFRSGGARSAGGGKGAPMRAASKCRILVRNIALEVQQAAVRTFFSQFGQVTEAVKFPEARYAFVHFFDADDAAAAIAAVDRQVVPELNPAVPLYASYRDQSSGGGGSSSAFGNAGAATRKAGSGGGHPISATPTGKLFVGHLAGGVTVKDLEAVFGRFGPVYDLELRRANGQGRTDQWAFVNFRRKQDALAAYQQLEWVAELTDNRPLKLQFRSA
ncbi:polyadenylate binding isoform B [Chlorella sorokiniana]|uniref:Polyadenylate binding isoform B n=1 Tax=Chlorella sorokiniana TaxID=3076 RepID=A0A2P6TJA1_CHLSO|nr:polyadenylate binding isoform B [Chlorella sorokiniana]|eukprot:PRW39313.1 polyadenylate binding isoform B [Chlorella sorokiniana]